MRALRLSPSRLLDWVAGTVVLLLIAGSAMGWYLAIKHTKPLLSQELCQAYRNWSDLAQGVDKMDVLCP